MTGTSLNLSLLSRGVGEVHKNGHEKVDVYLEPEDYYNFSANPDRFYLPPIRTSYTGPHHHHNHSSFFDTAPLSRGPPSHSLTTRTSRDATAAAAVATQEFRVPKTFTTRKGALLLFSEDLAQRNIGREGSRPPHHEKSGGLSALNSITPASSLDSQVSLKTVEDLANSILKYGDHDRPDNAVYLKFVHARRDNFTRQIRPGYSAKRYLSTWTRTWDDTVFDKVIKHGYITERSLYQYNLIMPNMRRRLFYEDLSHMPQPYRLMRNMLMMPGSLSGYTFYRAPTSEFAEDSEGEQESVVLRKRPETNLRNIRVIKTKAGVQEEIAYSDLDRQSQKEVITDLLVKSAVHYALKKQEEIYKETIIRAVHSGQDGLVTERPAASAAVHEFDMRDAVESLLDSQNGRYTIGGDLPEIDDRSHSSDMGGSFKGGAMPRALAKHHQATKSAWAADTSDTDKEYVGGVPVASVKNASGSEGSVVSSQGAPSLSNVPVLPPIRHTLSPIRDVSRETTQPNIPLPSAKDNATTSSEVPAVHIQPATPQHSVLTGGSEANATRGLVSRDAQDALPDLEEEDRETETVPDGVISKKASEASMHSSERDKGKTSGSEIGVPDQAVHPAGASVAGTSQTGKSRPSWKGGLRKGPGSQVESQRGSTIMAPDGEIISVGGSVARTAQGAIYDVGNINDVIIPHSHRHEGAGTDESGASDDEPDEWKTAKKMSISLRSDRDSHKKQYKRGSSRSITSGSSVSREEWDKLSAAGKGILQTQAGGRLSLTGSLPDGGSQRSSVTEKDIMDTLTDHAQRIAESVLSQPNAGEDLENDVKHAAKVWADTHPPRPVSRRASVREARAEAIAEILKNRRASSAAPSVAEYRNLIKKSLAEAAAKAAGIDPESLSTEDAEISPDLLEALATQKLTPDQIEVVSDSSGRTRIQSRAELQGAMGGVEEGHLYIAPAKKGEETVGKRQTSIPADKVSVMDDMEFDRISYQGTDVGSEKGEKRGKSKAGSKPGSIAGGTMADLSEMEGMIAAMEGKMDGEAEPAEPEDDFLKAVQQVAGDQANAGPPSEPRLPGSGKTTPSAVTEKAPASIPSDKGQKTPPTLPPGGPPEVKPEDLQSQKSGKSGKTGVSQKSEASKNSKTKGKKTPEEKEEPFVVGLMDHKDELAALYGSVGGVPPKAGSPKGKPKEKKTKKEPLPPKKEEKKPKKTKKGKKGKKKEEEVVAPPPREPTPPPMNKEVTPTPRKEPTPAPSEPKPSSPEFKTDESDLEFNFIREQSSPEGDHPPQTKLTIPPSPPLDEEDDEKSEEGAEEDSNLKSISNREARAAKRAAAAAKRREEVERRRREKEELARKEKEEVERKVALQREMEEERRRREEERRLMKERQREQEERERREKSEVEKKKLAEAERERRQKEDYQRKLEEMKRKQQEEELRRHEIMLQKQREEEERRLAEEEMMSQMAEQERLAYEEKKRQEEEERKRKELEEQLRRAEEAKKAMEEAKRLAEEMARKQAELEARLKFNKALQEEASGLGHSQEINRAFVFSYFELLQWLGLDIPEFELAKLADY